MMYRTSSGPAGTPSRRSWAWTRRYPYVSSESVKIILMSAASCWRRAWVADIGCFNHWKYQDAETDSQVHILRTG